MARSLLIICLVATALASTSWLAVENQPEPLQARGPRVLAAPVVCESGLSVPGVFIDWTNWPARVAYVIEKSTNLIDWTESFRSPGDDGRVTVISEMQPREFYRIRQQP